MVALPVCKHFDLLQLDHPIDLDVIQVAFDYRTRHIHTVGGLKGRKVAAILGRTFNPRHIGIEYELDYRDDSIWTGRTCVWRTGARQVLQFALVYEQERMG
jgi:hypothetical protein